MSVERMPGMKPWTNGLPETFQPLPGLPLLVLVGVTGVGKSTTLSSLEQLGVRFSVLPNRREVTDAVMIEPLAGSPVSDREERFRLTARYRETHPGGMAQALASLAVDLNHWTSPLLFDGLRGLDEVRYATEHLPLARFVVLGAPDMVRVRRLLGRADHFDRVVTTGEEAGGQRLLAQLRALEGVREVFEEDALEQLAALPGEGIDRADVLGKVRIVVSERRHYDPRSAQEWLEHLPPRRALILDTAAFSATDVARRIQEWL
ncbi:ATPase [Deinococcus peraridilitoris]|uniref:ATPase n=1 Tax=Deinococcus peraridilitoris TaxID=432329 RepID=UPI001FDEE916|nr:ATPase [Deinococcus peraridilitoris]